MISVRREQLIEALQDKEYREAYAEEHIKTGLAFQIRAMREAQGWTQTDLGDKAGKPQTGISQLEDPDYGRFQLRTLLSLASAFDVALLVRFAPYSELLDWTLSLSPERLAPLGFDKDLHQSIDTRSIPRQGANELFLTQAAAGIGTTEIDDTPVEPSKSTPKRENAYAAAA